MNNVAQQETAILHQTQGMRNQLMDMLTDTDLAFRVPGNPTLGELCWEIGAIQRSYTDSFRFFKQDLNIGKPDPALTSSIERLKAWYKTLEDEMDAAIGSISEEDAQNRMIDRGFPLPVRPQIHVYREALLIFLSKANVYLRALNKPPTGQLLEWIG